MKEGDFVNKWNSIIPAGKRIDHVYVDEPSEFAALAAQTDSRKRREAEDVQESLKERNRQRREARQERRRIVHNCKLLMLGMASACCGICAVLAWRAAYPALAIFPAALALLAIRAGVRTK